MRLIRGSSLEYLPETPGLNGRQALREYAVSDIELDYDYLANNALRRVVADVLKITADLGEAPGEHHFYIEFTTGAPGVEIPSDLKAAYPTTMTIVLQHQFENLLVNEDGFSVTLWFKGKQADLVIPFDAVASFADPSVQFGLRFKDDDSADEDGADAPAPPPRVRNETPETADADAASSFDTPNKAARSEEKSPTDESPEDKVEQEDKAEQSDGADVVSLDAFRKK